jgi:hypothetical protein
MSIAATAVTSNTVSSLQQLFKKVQTGMLTALQDQTPELKWLRKTPMANLIPSGLEMRLILNVLFQGGGQMIPDGGYESTTGLQAPQSGTVSFVQYNNRFALTGLGRLYDKHAKSGEVMQLNYYGAKKVLEAMGRKMGYQTYGFSTGSIAVVDTTVTQTTGDVKLKQAFGSSLIGSSNAAATANQLTYLAQLFRAIGEIIAPIASNDVVTNGQGTVNSVSNAAGTVNVTNPGSATYTAGNPLVYFNTVTDVTKAGTELNLWPSGLLDATQSTSLHGLSSTDRAQLGELHRHVRRPVRLHQVPQDGAVHQQLRWDGARYGHPVEWCAERCDRGRTLGSYLLQHVDVRSGRQSRQEGRRDPHVALGASGARVRVRLGGLHEADAG